MTPVGDFTHVHQVLPSLHVADASGAHTLHARDALRRAGFESEVFVDHVDPELEAEVMRFEALDDHVAGSKTAIIYQFAVGSRLADLLISRSEPLIVNYHNLTPASFFWKWSPDWLVAVELGRSQLYRLARRAVHAIAVSEFNERDLLASGYASTSVVPPFVDVSAFEPASQDARGPGPAQKPRGATWLFVGKLLPHKAAHDLVRALAAYRAAYDPDARLVLLGGHPVGSYAGAVRMYAESLGLKEAVVMTGAASDAELVAAYAGADVFVCLSDHEGFCFPLLEALNREVPVVAYAAGAVPATLGHAGVLVGDKSGPEVAAAVHRVVSDGSLRERLVAEGRAQLARFDLGRTKEDFAEDVKQALHRITSVAGDGARDTAVASTVPVERQFTPAPRGGPVSQIGGLLAERTVPIGAVHQLVPMLVPGDATSDHAIALRRLLHDMGLESEIFASAIHDDLHAEAVLLHRLPDATLPGTLFVYQMSSASPMADLVRQRTEPLAVNFHNVTPASAYDGWDAAVAADQRWARRQVADLAGRASVGICDSAFNATDLVARNYAATEVCPVLVDMGRLSERGTSGPESVVEEELAARRGSGIPSWLFVGRISPHKRQHRLVQALASHVEMYGARAHLDLVGSPGPVTYADAVRNCAEALGLAADVTLAGGVGPHDLSAYYRNADVLVSASVHEGFCIPIVEAMHHGVPVVAMSAAAVPETVDGAGLLVERDDPAVFASSVRSVTTDPGLRERLVAAGTKRASELSLDRSRQTMRRVLERWIDANGRYEPGHRWLGTVAEPLDAITAVAV